MNRIFPEQLASNLNSHLAKVYFLVGTDPLLLSESEDLIHHVTDRPGHDRRYAIDPTKTRQELGWEPTTSFDEGIKQTIDWYKTHRQWWEQIISGEYANYYEKMYGNR